MNMILQMENLERGALSFWIAMGDVSLSLYRFACPRCARILKARRRGLEGRAGMCPACEGRLFFPARRWRLILGRWGRCWRWWRKEDANGGGTDAGPGGVAFGAGDVSGIYDMARAIAGADGGGAMAAFADFGGIA